MYKIILHYSRKSPTKHQKRERKKKGFEKKKKYGGGVFVNVCNSVKKKNPPPGEATPPKLGGRIADTWRQGAGPQKKRRKTE